MMNGGEVVVTTLLSRDVDTVFFVPGGTYVTVLEALSRVQNKIKSVPTRLESSATFAAETYSAIRRKPACVFVSRGARRVERRHRHPHRDAGIAAHGVVHSQHPTQPERPRGVSGN